MSSLIPGYEYDIFISYRQKDNKHDGWVTEFVDNLKGELESTFKEEISVYFDINPHDGLLETHDVDESLKDKLKCLVFIPIISRTYCDPKAFAWEHEFKTFVDQASKDQFGLKLKLPNGNVASRVLPISIYDLDPDDIKLCESVLGGILRGIDFIYAEPGVNRPLKPDDDEKINLNKTKYRNQINKVGNAIKDIITAIRHHEPKLEEVAQKAYEPVIIPRKSKKTTIIAVTIIALALIILGFIFIPKLFKPEEQLEKSIAVLPFVNLSNDPEQEYFSDGIVEAILNHLFKVGELKVISSTSTKRYKNTELSIKEIAKELGVSSILEGSVQKIGDNVRITAQLIDAGTDVHLWSEIYDRHISDIFRIQSEVAQNVASELKTTLTAESRQQIRKNETENPEAYNLYLQGRFHMQKRNMEGFNRSIEYFQKAIAEDPDYSLAYAGLADVYFLIAWWDLMPKPEAYARSKEYAEEALHLDKDLAEAHTVLGGILYWNEWKWEEARKELQLAVELNPNFVPAHQYYSELLDILNERSEARKHINIAMELDPFFYMEHSMSGLYYENEGRYKEALDEYKIVQELNPEANLWQDFFINYVIQGEDLTAIEVLEHALEENRLWDDSLPAEYADSFKDNISKSDLTGILDLLIEIDLKRSPPLSMRLATLYIITGNTDEALDWLEKAFEDCESRIPRINSDYVISRLRSEPRFQALIEKMGLTDYQVLK